MSKHFFKFASQNFHVANNIHFIIGLIINKVVWNYNFINLVTKYSFKWVAFNLTHSIISLLGKKIPIDPSIDGITASS